MSALKHVETIVANSQATVDFTGVFTAGSSYVIFIDNFIPATDRQALRARFSSDNGSNWDSGASDYAYSTHLTQSDGATSSLGSGGTSNIDDVVYPPGASPGSNDTSMSVVEIYDPADVNSATVLRTKSIMYAVSATPNLHTVFNGGERLTQSAVDSIRLYTSSGNISSGIFSVYELVSDASGGAMDHIETIEASSQATVDFTSVFGSSDGYDRYKIFCDNVVVSSDNSTVQLQMSSDGGSNWDTGSSDYARSRFTVTPGGTGTAGSSSDSKIHVIQGSGDDASSNDTNMSEIVVSDPTNANRATVLRASSSAYNSSLSNSSLAQYLGGIRLTQSAVDSIRFLMSSGNISSGIFSVYGIGS